MSTRARRQAPQILVRLLSAKAQTGLVVCGNLRFRCALGRTGVRATKREGDGATPRGRFGLGAILYNPAVAGRPRTALSVRALRSFDGWCDAPGDRNYNRPVELPYPARAERLWRDDGVYDVIVVLGYNIAPRMRHRGSAIFMHVARPGFLPTEGCIALRGGDLLRLLAVVRPRTKVITTV